MTSRERAKQGDRALQTQSEGEQRWAPRVDLYENDHEVLMHADVPGVEKRALQLGVEGDQLTLEAKVNGSETPSWWKGVWHRTFILPAGIDAARISAELVHGVLTVRLPKHDAIRPRRIEVQPG